MIQNFVLYIIASLSALIVYFACSMLQARSHSLLLVFGSLAILAFDLWFAGQGEWHFVPVVARYLFYLPFVMIGTGLLQSVIDDVGNFGRRFLLLFISSNIYGCVILLIFKSIPGIENKLILDWFFISPLPITATGLIWHSGQTRFRNKSSHADK